MFDAHPSPLALSARAVAAIALAWPPHRIATRRAVSRVIEFRNLAFANLIFFCLQTEDGSRDPRVIVESEDEPERLLLETKIQKEDGFQKQQGK